eukprot:12421458-Karenia_brevis.AAC.1
MPKRPDLGDQDAWAATDMMIRNKHGNLAQQTEALEKTIPKERRLRWMASWFVWGVQRACSDKAIRGLNDILIQANTVKENAANMHEKKKALMDKLAIEIPNEGSEENKAQMLEERKILAADLEALNSKIPEYIDLGRNLVSILDHD